MPTETITYMGELIDICVECQHDVDHCKCEED